jgi:hypothetical protein
MKRFWFMFLAVLVFAQASYAFAGAYCTHERDRTTSTGHWGHHFHSHSVNGTDQSETTKNPKSSFHPDCGFCHSVASLAITPASTLTFGEPAAPFNAQAPTTLLSCPASA